MRKPHGEEGKMCERGGGRKSKCLGQLLALLPLSQLPVFWCILGDLRLAGVPSPRGAVPWWWAGFSAGARRGFSAAGPEFPPLLLQSQCQEAREQRGVSLSLLQPPPPYKDLPPAWYGITKSLCITQGCVCTRVQTVLWQTSKLTLKNIWNPDSFIHNSSKSKFVTLGWRLCVGSFLNLAQVGQPQALAFACLKPFSRTPLRTATTTFCKELLLFGSCWAVGIAAVAMKPGRPSTSWCQTLRFKELKGFLLSGNFALLCTSLFFFFLFLSLSKPVFMQESFLNYWENHTNRVNWVKTPPACCVVGFGIYMLQLPSSETYQPGT